MRLPAAKYELFGEGRADLGPGRPFGVGQLETTPTSLIRELLGKSIEPFFAKTLGIQNEIGGAQAQQMRAGMENLVRVPDVACPLGNARLRSAADNQAKTKSLRERAHHVLRFVPSSHLIGILAHSKELTNTRQQGETFPRRPGRSYFFSIRLGLRSV